MEVFLKNQPLPEGIETKMDDTFFLQTKDCSAKPNRNLAPTNDQYNLSFNKSACGLILIHEN